jgi:hypothetical protein
MDRGFQQDSRNDYRVKKELTIEMFQQMFAHKSLWSLWPHNRSTSAQQPSSTKSVRRS